MKTEEKLIKELHADDFDAEVLGADVPVMVYFWAPWCGPCRMVAPLLEQLADEYEGKARICKVNVDEEAELSLRYGVMSIPAVFVFKNGEIAEQAVGAYPKEHFDEMLRRAL